MKWARTLDAQLSAGGADGGGTGDAGVIRMHFSGCSASCAQPQIADIGFRGDIAHVDEHIEEAVDIGLGGSLGPDAAFIDWVTGAMPVDRVPDALLRVVDRYQAERRAPSRSTPGPGAPRNTSWPPPSPEPPRWSAHEALPGARGDERHHRASGQGVVLGARGRRDPRRPLHPVRHLRRRLPVQLHRHRRGHQPARAGQDVHRVLAVLGLLPPGRAALRGAVAAVDRRRRRGGRGASRPRSGPTPPTPTGRSPVAPRPTGWARWSRASPCAPRPRWTTSRTAARSARCSSGCWRPGRSTARWSPSPAAIPTSSGRASPPSPPRPSEIQAASGSFYNQTMALAELDLSSLQAAGPSRASPWWGRPARCRGSAPCRPGAGRPGPTGSTPWC